MDNQEILTSPKIPLQSSKFSIIGKIARIVAIIFLTFFGLLEGVFLTLALPFTLPSKTPPEVIQNILVIISGYIYLFVAYILIKNNRNKFRLALLLLLFTGGIFIGQSVFTYLTSKRIPPNELVNFMLQITPLFLVFLSYKLEPPVQELFAEQIIEQRLNEPFSPLQYQGIFIRATANIVDQLIIFIPIYLLIFLFGQKNYTQQFYTFGGIIFIIYCSVCEGIYGKTVGKKLVGIKVMMQDGRSCTWRGALIRNIGRILDVLLGSYLLGIIAIIVTKRKQRIGDLLARTVVIKE